MVQSIVPSNTTFQWIFWKVCQDYQDMLGSSNEEHVLIICIFMKIDSRGGQDQGRLIIVNWHTFVVYEPSTWTLAQQNCCLFQWHSVLIRVKGACTAFKECCVRTTSQQTINMKQHSFMNSSVLFFGYRIQVGSNLVGIHQNMFHSHRWLSF